ncbi:hypothetical protein ACQKQD_29960 [Methylobacterium sp. NPDC080182]|uniref:hypothetical protein n=1 Tax=Methylobacterium sp. NPDC080182 TaxID=3390590 RepID=UPI003D04DF43
MGPDPAQAHKQMTLAKLVYRCSEQRDGPFVAGIAQANGLIPNAGRFIVDQSVMDAVLRMEKTPFADLLRTLDHARPPFPLTWIEWGAPGGGHLGYLVEQAEGTSGFAFRQFLHARGIERATGSTVVCTLGRIHVDPSGFRCENVAEAATSGNGPGPNPHEQAAADLISMFLIINSPSGVVTIDAAPDTQRVDARRIAKGRPPLPNLRPIRLDVARLRQIDVDDGAAQADGRPRAEHFVRGHFKFRNGRMWWWSPHIRNQAGNEPAALPRDYQVMSSEAG